MSVELDAARKLATTPDAEATGLLNDKDLLNPTGLDDLLAAARSLIRDDPAVGERLAELVRRHATQAQHPAALPRADYLLAQARAVSGDMAGALQLIDAAHDEFAGLGLTTEALRTNLGRSQALNEMGRHDEALAACTRILDGADADDPGTVGLLAAAHQNSGLCLELSGRFEAALDHYASAKIGYEAIGDTRSVAEVTYDRALVLLTLGQHTEALSALRRAADAFADGGYRALQVMAQAHTAEVLLHRGEYQECLDVLAAASRALDGISAPAGEKTRMLVAARAHLALNLLPEAHDAFERLVNDLAETDLAIDQARARWGLGLSLARAGRATAADDALQAAASQFRSSGQSSWLAEVLVDIARLQHSTGAAESARTSASEAFEVAAKDTPAQIAAELLLAELTDRPDQLRRIEADAIMSGLAPLTAAAAHANGAALLRAGHLHEAVAALQRAVDAVESLRGNLANELALTRFLDDKLSPYDDLLAAMVATDAEASAVLAVAERARSRTLSDVVSGLVARDHGTVSDDEDRDLRALYGELFAGDTADDPGRVERLRQRIRELEARRERARLETTPAAPTARSDRGPTSEVIPAGAAAVSYVRAGDRLYALATHEGRVEPVVDLADVREVDAAAERLRRQWDRFRIGPDLVERHLPQLLAATRSVLHDLYGLVMAPLEPLLASLELNELVIVPDSPLHDVPLHALFDGDDWLLHRFTIRYTPSLHTLHHLPPPRAGRTVACGTADELAPSVDDEVRAVGRHRSDSVVLVGDRATWTEVAPLLAGAAHVHLAGHALFRPDNPMYSALRLYDRWITAGDLLRLDLTGATAVLSACDTGRTQHTRAAEVNGFVRGLLGAGASSVIASQWTADDAATVGLMEEFYSRLANRTTAAALREAQLTVAERFPHPYYWASWALVGRSD